MAIIALKAWYIEQYEPLTEIVKRPHDLRLSRNSLLKSGLRADFLDDAEQVRTSTWFRRYLEGEKIEFYLEGSGGYVISNLDLISQEVYFTKQELLASLTPTVFFSYQQQDAIAYDSLLGVLNNTIEEVNKQLRFPLTLELAERASEGATRMSDSQLRKIRKSLLFIADISPLVALKQEETAILFPHPNVCLEIGYALQTKRSQQILLVTRERIDLGGNFPFDIAQQLSFNSVVELAEIMPLMITSMLQKFNLFNY
jgi:hypothetical protein